MKHGKNGIEADAKCGASMQYVLARMRFMPWSWHPTSMLGAHALPPLNLQALPPRASAWIARW